MFFNLSYLTYRALALAAGSKLWEENAENDNIRLYLYYTIVQYCVNEFAENSQFSSNIRLFLYVLL